jgi:bacillithiol biosynthesis deacetylase BshB1
VGILALTDGGSGTTGSAPLRDREAARAAEILGVSVRECAGLPDAGLFHDAASRRVVVERLRALRPRVVVTHWSAARHPDHRITSELVTDACFLAGLSRYPAEGEPHRPFKLVYATAFREDADPPTFVIDITAQMERKLAALAAYGSQFEGKAGVGEVFPGGDRPVFEQIRAACARYGSLARVAYAEPFRTRETLLQDSLGTQWTSTSSLRHEGVSEPWTASATADAAPPPQSQGQSHWEISRGRCPTGSPDSRWTHTSGSV